MYERSLKVRYAEYKGGSRKRAIRQNVMGYMFMAPWIVGFLSLTLFPFMFTIYLSLQNVRFSNTHGWEMLYVGINNFAAAFLQNTEFTPALISFFSMIAVYIPVIIVVSFLLSLALNANIKLKSFFRSIYFLPAIILSGPVMYSIMDAGNTQSFSLRGIFIYDIIAMYSPVVANGFEYLFQNFVLVLWFTGIPIILFINGLQKIPAQVLEAAEIDGATGWQILWKIIIPIIKPIGLTVTIFSIVQLGVFAVNPVYDLILGAMQNTVSGMGFAAAFAVVYSLVILLFIGVSILIFRTRKDDKE